MDPNKEILLVEDDRDFSESLHLLLEMKGFSISAVTSGEDALDDYSDRYDYVLMDIKLPGITGIETLELILKKNPTAKVLLMTGCERGSGEVASANMTGAVGVLYKPFRINDLLRLLAD